MRGRFKLNLFGGMATVAVVLAYAGNSHAAPILSLFQPGANQASDEDREYLIDNVVTVPGQIDMGDVFRGHINFNTLNSASANVGGTTGNNELSGVFQVLVTGKAALGPPGLFSFTFGPDPTFAEGLGTVGGAPIIVLWEDASPDFAGDFDDPPPSAAPPADTDADDTNGPFDDGTPGPDRGPAGPGATPPSSADVGTGPFATEEAFIATASDGTRFITLGFSGQAGEGFTAISTSGDNVLAFFSLTSGTSGATNNFALSVLDGPGVETADPIVFGATPSPFGPTPGFIGVVGSQQLRGVSDLDTAFEISTNTNVSFNVQNIIPEPGSLLVWLGLAAIVTGRMGRRRNS